MSLLSDLRAELAEWRRRDLERRSRHRERVASRSRDAILNAVSEAVSDLTETHAVRIESILDVEDAPHRNEAAFQEICAVATRRGQERNRLQTLATVWRQEHPETGGPYADALTELLNEQDATNSEHDVRRSRERASDVRAATPIRSDAREVRMSGVRHRLSLACRGQTGHYTVVSTEDLFDLRMDYMRLQKRVAAYERVPREIVPRANFTVPDEEEV